MEHIVVPTEVDALLLENNLIKYRPRYNILLKDDKTPSLDLHQKKNPSPGIQYTKSDPRWFRIFLDPIPT